MGRIISSWLKGNYDTEMHGPPTWKMLVEAVCASTGGNNRALAKRIAKDHPHTPQASPVSYNNYSQGGRLTVMSSVLCIGSPESG